MSQYQENFDFNLSQFSTQMSEEDVFSFADELQEAELKQELERYMMREQLRNGLALTHGQARNTPRPSLDTLAKVQREFQILEQDIAGLIALTVQVGENKKSPQQFAKKTSQQQYPSQDRSPHGRKQGFNQHGSPSDPLQQFQIQRDDNSDSPSPDRNNNRPKKLPSKRKEAFDESDNNLQSIHSMIYELTVEEFDKSIETLSHTRGVNMPDVNAYKSNPKQQRRQLQEQAELHQQQSIGSYEQFQSKESSDNHYQGQGEILLEGSMCAQCKRVCSCFHQL